MQYLRSTFLPGEEKCFCLFEGPSAEVVRTANDRAELPYERIVEAHARGLRRPRLAGGPDGSINNDNC